ncbi:MAG: hypothetical protein ACOC7L_01430 [Acidobacteriota bacterium]
MTMYPILFNVRDPVVGKGFLAGVAVDGRALMREEEDGYWIDGVFPGAVCAGGESRDEALLKFRQTYRMVLYDFAASAKSFEDFREKVERFFWEETPGEAEAWSEAAVALRRDRSKAGDWLPIKKRYPDPTIRVTLLEYQSLEPQANSEERVELAGDKAPMAA